MSRHTCVLIAVAVGLLGLGACAANAQTLYGISGSTFPNNLVTINTTTGAATVVGPITPTFAGFGLTFRAGKLYTFDGGARSVRELNPATGSPISSLPIGLPPAGWNGGGLALRPSDGIGFLGRGATGTQFYSFDMVAGTNNLITGTQNTNLVAFTFNAANVLYGSAGNSLYTIDQVTGAMTLVGNTGILGPRVITGLAFDASSNLYATTIDQSGAPFPSFLYTINTTTGVATFVANVSIDNTQDIAFGTAGPPPVAGVTVTQSGGSTNVAEGGATDTYTVVLNTAPTASVTITLNPGTQLSVAPTTLTFTTANWSTAQTVTVTAVDDAAVEGAHVGTVTHTAASTDLAYNGIAIASVTANITDNDVGPPLPPPQPPPTGGGEGNYTSGFPGGGGRMAPYRIPILTAPTAVPAVPTGFRVVNVSLEQPTPGEAAADTGFGLTGWCLLAGLVLAAGGILSARYRWS